MATARTPSTSKWQLNLAAFDQFLACLHPNRTQAGEVWERLRPKLILYFQSRCFFLTPAQSLRPGKYEVILDSLTTADEKTDTNFYSFTLIRR